MPSSSSPFPASTTTSTSSTTNVNNHSTSNIHIHNNARMMNTKHNPKSSKSKPKKPAYPSVYYYSKSTARRHLTTQDLPHEPGARGIYSPWALLWGCLFAIPPVAYIYIALILLREISESWPDTVQWFLATYLPPLFKVIVMMQQSSRLVEAWCVLEAVFYIVVKLYISYLGTRDPLEASLQSAPFLTAAQRALLWHRMMAIEQSHDPASLITGWFFDQDIHKLSRYDVREFVTWSMFEGRNQEHLTRTELGQLEEFVQQLEHLISLHWYGEQEASLEEEEEEEKVDNNNNVVDGVTPVTPQRLPVPRKMFRFPELEQHAPPNFFSNLYESYRKAYEKYRSMMMESTTFHNYNINAHNKNSSGGEFHPMEDFWNFMAHTTQQIIDAEEAARATATWHAESAMATATQTAENLTHTATQTATQMYEHIIQPVIGEKTTRELIHAFHSVKQGMKERLETAKFLANRRKMIRQQLKGYHAMLQRLRDMSSEVPSTQMAVLMRRITESNQALERLESRAREAFVHATGYARKNLSSWSSGSGGNGSGEPQRYAKYSSDPLLGVATFPLGFHLLILGATELPLRYMLAQRGFQRRTIGSTNYYFHPGDCSLQQDDEDDEEEDDDDDDDEYDEDLQKTPIVFVHGIGIGLISYIPLIDAMLKTGRAIFLPEIPYVCGFRPWQGPNCVLPPAVVCSTMTAMLATHGYLRGTFAGHSYGTSWLSYMCKYAPTAVAALLFLDPICFCLHVSRLTKKFVYHRPDPGCISYIVRTDLIVHWTIQRCFPWAWIILFTEQIHVPCSVFLSDQDALVPAEKVEDYLRSKGAPVVDFKPGMQIKDLFEQQQQQQQQQQQEGVGEMSRSSSSDSGSGSENESSTSADPKITTNKADQGSLSQDDSDNDSTTPMLNGCIFRGHGHGDWTDYPRHTVPVIADCIEVLCNQAESISRKQKNRWNE